MSDKDQPLSEEIIDKLLKESKDDSVKIEYKKYKEVPNALCPRYGSQQSQKQSLAHPGNKISFLCRKCQYSFFKSYPFLIQLEDDDYWFAKYRNQNLIPVISKEEIEKTLAIEIEDKEWLQGLFYYVSICEKCSSTDIQVDLNREHGLNTLIISCKKCGKDTHVIL